MTERCRRPQSATPQQKEFMEQTANMVARDNVELACCFIQKTAIEKAILDIDKRLATVGHGGAESSPGLPTVFLYNWPLHYSGKE